MFEYTLEFIWELFDTLSVNVAPIFSFLNDSFSIGSWEFSVYEIIFGGGLITVLAIRVAIWITDLIVPN